MQAEIISVGDELQRGDIVNTNAAFIARQLRQLNTVVKRQETVNDQLTAIKEALTTAVHQFDLVIVTGGLGPTADDVTLQAVASALQEPIKVSERQWRQIQQIFAERQIALTSENRRQAQYIGEPLNNSNGLALGSWCQKENSIVVVLPGPPVECEQMVTAEVQPRLQALVGRQTNLYSKTLHFLGRPESLLMEDLAPIIQHPQLISVTSYVKPNDIQLRLVALKPGMEDELQAISQQIIDREQDYYLGEGNQFNLATAVVKLLHKQQLKISAAESLTGGLFQSTICSVPGASNIFDGGFVTYAASAKETLVGVRPQTVEQFGVVSQQTAEEMAQGCRQKLGVDFGMGFTGVAGPGPLEGHPAGTVWISLATSQGTISRQLHLANNWGRQRIRELSVQYGLQLLYQELKNNRTVVR